MPRYAPFEPDVAARPGSRAPRPGFEVRAAGPMDVAGIVAVAATRGEQPADLPGRVAGWVVDDERCVLVAVAGATGAGDDAVGQGGVVGWGMVSRWVPEDAPHGFVVSALTVHPAWWRRSLGTSLLAGLQRWTRERADELWSIVNARNETSLALHARLGFAAVDRAAGFGGVTFDGGEGVLLRWPES